MSRILIVDNEVDVLKALQPDAARRTLSGCADLHPED